MRTYKVLLVEDFEAFRQFASSELQRRPDLRVVGQVSDALEAVERARELQPDLILLDIGLPSLSGIEVARRIRKLSPNSRIVFLTQESSPEVMQEAINVGASGYVVKSRLGRELLAAVDAALAGKIFLSGTCSTPRSQTPHRCHDVQFYSDEHESGGRGHRQRNRGRGVHPIGCC